MALPLPSSLSPSKVATFKGCALAFRYSAIDKLPEPPSEPAMKGTLVHRALELLFAAEPTERTPDLAAECLAEALVEMRADDEYALLGLSEAAEASFAADAAKMVERYFQLEDPRDVTPVGLELMLEADLDGTLMRGIIDRLEEDADGNLVVTDYKTGRAPMQTQEQSRLGGVHFYAYLCERVLGRLPSKVQLIYLGREPQVITTTPSEQSVRGLEKRVQAIWAAIERACERDDFRPQPSRLCDWCAFTEYCPAVGGDPEKAVEVAAEIAARSQSEARSVPASTPTAPAPS